MYPGKKQLHNVPTLGSDTSQDVSVLVSGRPKGLFLLTGSSSSINKRGVVQAITVPAAITQMLARLHTCEVYFFSGLSISNK